MGMFDEKNKESFKGSIPYKHRGVENGKQFDIWRDSEGRDWVYFHEHPANDRPEEWKTEPFVRKKESEKDRYERMKRANGYE